MNKVQQFFWLAQQAFEGLLFLWQITLVLIVLIGVAASYNFPFTSSRFERKHLLVFSPLLLSIATLLIGSLFAHHSSGRASQFSAILVETLFWLHLPLGAFIIYNLKGFRWFAMSVILFEVWVGVACAFIAGMSVTGKWL